MGNVIASEINSKLSSAGDFAIPPPALYKDTDKSPPLLSDLLPSLNPGSFEELHKRCKDVFPMTFDGARIMINKGLSNHFQVSHTIMLGAANAGYRFGATYVGNKQLSPSEAFPVLLGDMDINGNLNAQILHQPNPNLKCKLVCQIQGNKLSTNQMSLDFKGSDYTASLTLGNPNLITESGIVVGHYLQAVTRRLALGAEMMYQRSPHIPGGHAAIMTFGGKYSAEKFTASVSLGGAGLHASYWHRNEENSPIQVGVEVETNLMFQESVASIGYQVDFPKNNFIYRGFVDTNWTVGGVVEKKLLPLPLTLALSAALNHQKNQGKFGIGLILG